MTDPIADMFTRIRNGYLAHKIQVVMPTSRMKESIAAVLKTEQFITDFQITGEKPKMNLEINLKYTTDNQPAVNRLVRISKPGRRFYTRSSGLKDPLSGYGVAIVSTNKGVMSGQTARQQNLGGEVLCHIY